MWPAVILTFAVIFFGWVCYEYPANRVDRPQDGQFFAFPVQHFFMSKAQKAKERAARTGTASRGRLRDRARHISRLGKRASDPTKDGTRALEEEGLVLPLEDPVRAAATLGENDVAIYYSYGADDDRPDVQPAGNLTEVRAGARRLSSPRRQ